MSDASATAITPAVSIAPTASASANSGIAPSLMPGAIVQGQGTLTWFGLRIYDASLWSRDSMPVQSGFASTEFVLELRYARGLEGAAIAKRSGEEIARLGLGDETTRTGWVDRMGVIFPDVKADDRIAAWHRPGAATRFFLNGRPLGEIDGGEFTRAFFAIWLDEKTSQPALREALLRPAPSPSPSPSPRG